MCSICGFANFEREIDIDKNIIDKILPTENNMFVTPKSIDDDIEILSNIIARAINKASKEWKNEEVYH